MINENLRRALQLAFATVAATLVHQQMKIANLENILVSHGIAGENDLAVTGLEGSPAPYLGAHNEDIYCGILGHSKEEVAQWKKDGVI